MKKPVQLQVNAKGAWKNVMRFDAGDESGSAQVMEAAETLGRIGNVRFRIVIADGLSEVLTHYFPGNGWRHANHQGE